MNFFLPKQKKPAFIAAGLFLAALAPRLLLLREYRAGNPYFSAFLLDSEAYDHWIDEILRGDWIGEGVFYHAPLYPYFVALFFKVFGKDYSRFFLFQTTLSAATAPLLYWMGKDFFDSRTCILASLLFSFTGLFAFYSLKLLPVTLDIFLLVLFALVFQRAIREDRDRQWVLCGIIAGLLSLLRSNLLLLFPLMAGYFLWAPGRRKSLEKIRKACFFSLGFVLLVSASAARNAIIGGDFVLVASNGGETFYHGNNVNADGTYSPPPEITPSLQFQNEDARKVAEREVGRPLKDSEVSRFWIKKGLAFIMGDPGRYGMLELKKVWRMLSGLDSSIIYYMDFERKEFTPRLGLFPVNYSVVMPLALAGLWITRRDWKRNFILLGIIGIHAATLLIFFVTTRYRLPMLPFLILFAGYTLSRFQGRFYRKALFYGAAALLLFSLAAHRWERRRYQPNAGALYCNLGYSLADQGKYREALRLFEKARNLDPGSLTPYLGVISLYALSGATETAMKFYKMVFPSMSPRQVRETLRDPALKPIHGEIRSFLEGREKGGR